MKSYPNLYKGWTNELVQEAIRINRMDRFYDVVTFFDHDFIAKISSMILGRFGWLKLSSVAGTDDVLCQEEHVCDGETLMQDWNLGGAENHRTNRGAHPLCRSRNHRM